MARRIWVTADTHFGHAEAIELFGRPFRDVREMDGVLLDAINARVGKRDELLHLGDVFGGIDWKSRPARCEARATIARIRCRRIHLVTGNQDPVARSFARLFRSAKESRTFRMDAPEAMPQLRVVCHHYPLRQWRGMWSGALHLHGHAHGSVEEFGRSIDVGVDCWNFAPVPLEHLVELLCALPVPEGGFRRVHPVRPASTVPTRDA
jgi:calcineurin-like phosphoesterase family protein